ncbi:unnamed protein product [Ectocarpus sp. 12 AP-2014]
MSLKKLPELCREASGGKLSPLRDLLRFLRKEKIRRPDLCLQYGKQLLTYGRSLGDELWVIHEQMVTAALDSGDVPTAHEHLQVLTRKFPGSQRVRRLEGMRCEAEGSFAAAAAIYDEMVEANPANSLARKRQVAVLIAKGDTAGAVKALNGYLAEFAADGEAWLQLAKLHIGALNYASAAFCYEELVLVAPSDHVVHCRLGEVYYTMGGAENLMRARKHFSQSVDLLKAGNARGLHGLCQTCASLAAVKTSSKKLTGKEVEVNQALHLFAATELRKAYGAGDDQLASLADVVIKTQAASFSSDR